jgi:hypothetical protein
LAGEQTGGPAGKLLQIRIFVPVSKTVSGLWVRRGFKSLPLRLNRLNKRFALGNLAACPRQPGVTGCARYSNRRTESVEVHERLWESTCPMPTGARLAHDWRTARRSYEIDAGSQGGELRRDGEPVARRERSAGPRRTTLAEAPVCECGRQAGAPAMTPELKAIRKYIGRATRDRGNRGRQGSGARSRMIHRDARRLDRARASVASANVDV